MRSLDLAALRRAPAPTLEHEFRVVLAEGAFDRAVARGEADTTREVGGVLVGEVLRDDAGPYLRIDSTVDALHADEKGAELTFTHATWEHIHREMDGKHKDQRVVGWYHTHPGFGIFLSDRDQFIHKSFFDLPFQVALVYDPKSREHGVFTWRDNELRRARRYWIGGREQVWEGPRAAERGDSAIGGGGAANRAAMSPAARDPEPQPEVAAPIGALGSMAFAGVVALALGGAAGYWFGAGASSRALSEAEKAIAAAREEGARAQLATLPNDLLSVVRDALGDEPMRRPIAEALRTLDLALAAVAAPPAPGPQIALPLPGAFDVHAQLRAARDRLAAVLEGRYTAHATLSAIERAARQRADLHSDLARDVLEQRAGIGALYAELAEDARRAGDLARARRLLATAAHLDPGNRARYVLPEPGGAQPPPPAAARRIDAGAPAAEGGAR